MKSTKKLLLCILILICLQDNSNQFYKLDQPNAFNGTNDILPKLYFAPQLFSNEQSAQFGDYFWYQFYKRTYFMSKGQRDLQVDKFCDTLYDTDADNSVKNLSMNRFCKNEYAKNKLTKQMQDSYEFLMNFVVHMTSLKLTYDLVSSYQLYRDQDWAKQKTSETVPYQFKSIQNFSRLEKIFHRFQLFTRNIQQSNFFSDTKQPLLKEKLEHCEIYFFETKDKEIARSAQNFYSADDINSLMTSILQLHDVGDKMQYQNMFYIDRLERSVNRSKQLYDHEVQCMFSHMHNYFLKDVYKKQQPEQINTEYVLQQYALDYKQKTLVTNSIKRNARLDGIVSVMFVSSHQKFLSKNIIVLLTDFMINFYDKTGFVKENIYLSHFLDTQQRLFYIFQMLKYSQIRIVSQGNIFAQIDTDLSQDHFLSSLNKQGKFVIVALELSLFVMKQGQFEHIFQSLLVVQVVVFVLLTLSCGIFFFSVPTVLSIIALSVNLFSSDEGKDMSLERFSIDSTVAKKQDYVHKAVWDTVM